MPNQVLVSTNSFNSIEAAKFRMEYRVVGSANPPQCGHFDWQPNFSHTNAQLLADLIDTVQAVLLDRHTLTVLDTEIITLGIPALHSTYDAVEAENLGELLDYIYAEQTADQSKTSNDTLADVTGMSFAIGANETWIADFHISYRAGATGDIKLAITYPADCVIDGAGIGPGSNLSADASDGDARHQIIRPASGGLIAVFGGNKGQAGNSPTPALLKCRIKNGATAGTIQLQYAQNTSNGTSTEIFGASGSTGCSYLEARRVA